MAGDNDPATAGRLVGRDEVFGADTSFFILGAQGRGVFVGADATDVESGVRGKDVLRVRGGSMSLCGVHWDTRTQGKRENYLCATSSVLRGTAGYELRAVVLEQVFVKAHVLVLGEYGIVGLETVLGEHCLVTREI